MATNGALDDSLYQDVLAQLPFLNGYSQASAGFQVAPDVARDDIVSSIRAAIDEIVRQVPLVGEQVVHEPGPPGTTGRYFAAPWPDDGERNEIVRVKDCSSLLPSFTQILRAGASLSVLPAEHIVPFPGLPSPHGLTERVPVFALQVNFIRGGVILTFHTHHNLIDAAGTIQIGRMLAALLKGHTLDPAHIAQANRDRTRIVPLIPPGEPVRDYSYLRRPEGWAPSMPKSPFKWSEFRISLQGLATLRKNTMEGTKLLFSEDDALTAWIWKRLSTVRVARGIPATRVSKWARAVDGRAAMRIPAGYLGHMIHHAVAQMTLQELIAAPLSKIAAQLRGALQEVNNEHALRSYATFLANTPDKSTIVYGSPRNPDTDQGCSSNLSNEGGGEDAESAHFGPLLGPRRFGRRPSSAPIPGCLYFHPPEGNAVMIMVCFPEDDLNALKRDGEWRRFMRAVV
ncbi:uncharacterized protein BJX67DRAFT_391206 [Aspergillus lucknowensis]|uniref:Trichothecene 3-O-acetyltransferase-like N-terminal domain-containing protein n=1 Tax=Aspergillus lucknowensis TaxID=176173 RepID=A0ABR4LDV6_9EURO